MQSDPRPDSVSHAGPIIDTAVDAVVLIDQSGVIVAANASAAHMFGCEVDQLVGTSSLRHVPERHRARHPSDMGTLQQGLATSVNSGLVDESRTLRHDGRQRPIEVTKSEIRLAGQRLQALTFRDVFASRPANDSMSQSRAQLAAALASMSDAVFIVDTDGRVVEVNDGFVSFHRFKSRQECTASLDELALLFEVTTADGAALPADQRPVYRALRGEKSAGVELHVRRKDTGEAWTGSYSFAPVRDEYGAIVGGVVTGRDISAEKRTLEELKRSRGELRRLIASQDRAAEEERKRIARELHDDLQQTLAALRLHVAAIEQQARSSEAREAAALALALSEAALVSTRLIISALRPQILDDFGLKEALSPMLFAFGERTGLGWDIDVLGDTEAALPRDTETCLYRIAQESLQNIEKHARAQCVQVTLDLSDPQQIVLQIHDDGVGIQSVDLLKRQSFGVLGMEERVRAIGGMLTVRPGAVSGTVVEAVVPLPAPRGVLDVMA